MSDHVWVQENLEAYLASDLNADETEKVERHAAACSACEQELAEACHLGSVMDRLFSGTRPDASLEDRMVERVRTEEPQPRRKPTMWRFFAAVAAVFLFGVVGAIVQAVTMKGPSPFAGLRVPGLMKESQSALVGFVDNSSSMSTEGRPPSSDRVWAFPGNESKKKFDDAAESTKFDPAIGGSDGFRGRDRQNVKDKDESVEAMKEMLPAFDSAPASVVEALTRAKEAVPQPKMPLPSMVMPGIGIPGKGLPDMKGAPPPMAMRDDAGAKGKLLQGVSPFYRDKGPRAQELGKAERGYYEEREKAERGDGKQGESKAGATEEKLQEAAKDLLKDLLPDASKPSKNGDGDLFKLPTPVVVTPASPSYFKPPVPTPPPAASTTPARPGDPADPDGTVVGVKKPLPVEQPQKQEPPAEQPPVDMGRKIIRTGDMEFEIESFYSTIDTIGGLLKKITKGTGFIATTNSDKLPNGKMRGSIVVRMPPQYLDDFLKDLRDSLSKTGELKSQRIGSQDVTKAYTDTESELRAARAVEGRLIEIIKTGKGEIKDLIAAERELGVWRTKIEKMEGELRYYNNQVSLSTVTILLYEKEIQAPSAIVITERIGMRLEVDDVALAHEAALKAVAEAKGRVTRSELKQHAVGQLEAILHAEISPAARDAFSAKLMKLGIVSDHNTQRLQQAEGGSGRPLDLKFRQSDVRFEIAIHDLVNIRPRQTSSLQVAVIDVPETFNQLRDAILQAKGQVRVGQVSEQDKSNITGQIEFNVPSAEKANIEKLIAKLGAVLTRSNNQAPVNELSTARKHGYTLLLRDFASVPPREAVSVQVATTDVPARYRKLLAAIHAVKGYLRTNQLSEQDRLNITAHIDFSVMTADKANIDKLLDGKLDTFGAVLTRSNLEAPPGGLATEQKFGYSVVLRDFVSIPSRHAVNLRIATPDVAVFYQKVQAAVRAVKGDIRVNQLNEQDKQNITAQLDFSVMTTDKAAIDTLLESKQGEGATFTVLSRHNVEAPHGSLATEQKFGYSVMLRDFATIPPSKATELTYVASDVAGKYARLLKAIADINGQVGENKLNEQDKLNISALAKFTIPSGAKPAFDEILNEMGTVLSRNNVQAPVSELATDRKFGYSVVLRDLASIQPRETYKLQIATLDVQGSFRELQEAVAQVKGLVQLAKVAEDSRVSLAARFDFTIAGADRLALEKVIAKSGSALTRTSSQVPANELATDQKVGYELVLRSIANIPPRDKVQLKLEVKDVDAKVLDLKELLAASRGRVVDSTVDRQENGRVEAKVVLEIPLASQDVIMRQIKGNETLISQKTVRDQQVPENELATAQITVFLTGTAPIVPSDEGISSYINQSLYVAFRIFAVCIMVIIIGISAILPWALVGVVSYWVYSRMCSPTMSRIAVKPVPKPTAAPTPDASPKGNPPPPANS